VVCHQMVDDTALEWPEKFGLDPDEIRGLAPFEFLVRTKWGAMERG